jgi:hypothetical protein
VVLEVQPVCFSLVVGEDVFAIFVGVIGAAVFAAVVVDGFAEGGGDRGGIGTEGGVGVGVL